MSQPGSMVPPGAFVVPVKILAVPIMHLPLLMTHLMDQRTGSSGDVAKRSEERVCLVFWIVKVRWLVEPHVPVPVGIRFAIWFLRGIAAHLEVV